MYVFCPSCAHIDIIIMLEWNERNKFQWWRYKQIHSYTHRYIYVYIYQDTHIAYRYTYTYTLINLRISIKHIPAITMSISIFFSLVIHALLHVIQCNFFLPPSLCSSVVFFLFYSSSCGCCHDRMNESTASPIPHPYRRINERKERNEVMAWNGMYYFFLSLDGRCPIRQQWNVQ